MDRASEIMQPLVVSAARGPSAPEETNLIGLQEWGIAGPKH